MIHQTVQTNAGGKINAEADRGKNHRKGKTSCIGFANLEKAIDTGKNV